MPKRHQRPPTSAGYFNTMPSANRSHARGIAASPFGSVLDPRHIEVIRAERARYNISSAANAPKVKRRKSLSVIRMKAAKTANGGTPNPTVTFDTARLATGIHPLQFAELLQGYNHLLASSGNPPVERITFSFLIDNLPRAVNDAGGRSGSMRQQTITAFANFVERYKREFPEINPILRARLEAQAKAKADAEKTKKKQVRKKNA